jgi:excisionase family DNA binding protein
MPSRRISPQRPGLPDPFARPTLTIPEAAKLLGVSKSCAYEAAKQGHLPIIQVAGRRLVPTAKLLRLLGIDFTRFNAHRSPRHSWSPHSHQGVGEDRRIRGEVDGSAQNS